MKKIIISIGMLAVMGLSGNVKSQTIIASGICGGEGDGSNLTWVLEKIGSDTVLTISGSGAMADYLGNAILPPWWPSGDYFSYRYTIKTVIIGDSVTSVETLPFGLLV